MQSEYDAVLSDWVICEISGERRFLAGKVAHDRQGQFRDGAYISTSLVVNSVGDIADGNVVQTLNRRYLLTDRYRVDDEIFAKLDAWLASRDKPPHLFDVIATKDVELIGAYVLRAFRAGTAEAVWRRDGGE